MNIVVIRSDTKSANEIKFTFNQNVIAKMKPKKDSWGHKPMVSCTKACNKRKISRPKKNEIRLLLV